MRAAIDGVSELRVTASFTMGYDENLFKLCCFTFNPTNDINYYCYLIVFKKES